MIYRNEKQTDFFFFFNKEGIQMLKEGKRNVISIKEGNGEGDKREEYYDVNDERKQRHDDKRGIRENVIGVILKRKLKKKKINVDTNNNNR